MPEPKCEADDTELIVTMGLDKRADSSQPEIEFKIGGKLLSNGSVSSHPDFPNFWHHPFLLALKNNTINQ